MCIRDSLSVSSLSGAGGFRFSRVRYVYTQSEMMTVPIPHQLTGSVKPACTAETRMSSTPHTPEPPTAAVRAVVSVMT